jgi:hypothetical protein
MQNIHIKLWHHGEEENWSVEINGKHHKHVSTETVDELVEYVLVAAQEALMNPEAPLGSTAPQTVH